MLARVHARQEGEPVGESRCWQNALGARKRAALEQAVKCRRCGSPDSRENIEIRAV